MKVSSVNAGFFKLDGGAMFGVVPKTIWGKKHPSDESNLCSWSTRCLLVEEGNRLMLFDTGIGHKQDESFLKYYFLHGEDDLVPNIEAQGYAAADITDVILTHLHFDHCGGAVKREKDTLMPTFPNAQYHVSATHWEYATQNPNKREKPSFLKENIFPLEESGQLHLIDESNKQLTNNVCLELSNGHTIGLLVSYIQYKGKTLVFANDMVPSSVHIPINYVMAYDSYPSETMKEKEALYKKAIEEDYVLCFDHDPMYEACTLKQTERGIKMDEAIVLNEL